MIVYCPLGPVLSVSVGVKGPAAPGSVTGGSTPVDVEASVIASALATVASALDGPESDAFADDVDDGLGPAVLPPEDELPPPDDGDALPELPPDPAPELPAPACAPNPGEDVDAPVLGEPFPHATMTIATLKPDIIFLDTRPIGHLCSSQIGLSLFSVCAREWIEHRAIPKSVAMAGVVLRFGSCR
jgi:hypothetical protein